jgi:hypothetical protein
MSRQAVNIIILLLSILILVGLANIYFMLQKDKHILHPVEKSEEEAIDDDYTYAEPLDTKQKESASANQQIKDREKESDTQQKTERKKEASESTDREQPPAATRKEPEINVAYWVERSIPLTFESRGGAADTIQRQYRHVVRDLQQVQEHLKKGEHQQAMQLIRPMLWDRSNIYREDAEWYQILALISAGDTNTATNQLNRLLRDNIHLYYFLGRELHAELVPIRKLMQQQAQRERERSGNGY